MNGCPSLLYSRADFIKLQLHITVVVVVLIRVVIVVIIIIIIIIVVIMIIIIVIIYFEENFAARDISVKQSLPMT